MGKSTITVGILLALKARGLDPQPFKVGPDFLDPMHHSVLLDRTSRNLDTWMFPRAVPELFARASAGAGISIIEGVMGLYDGFDGRSEEGSTAHLSKVLQAPVVLVLDASASARSLGATALGFAKYDLGVNIPAVIFNNVAGPRHLEMLKDSLKGMECLGGMPNRREAELESRHLGLVPAEESFDRQRYELIRGMVEEHLDIDRLVAIAEAAPPLDIELTEELATGTRARIGVARDRAFNFYYEDNFHYLRRAGAEVVFFSPLDDELPDVDGLYFGGGYPELFAKELAASPVRDEVRALADAGMPVYAECGGLMYLCRTVIDLDGRSHDMAGVFDHEVRMSDRLEALGYVEPKVLRDTVLSPRGGTVRGHVFHYSHLVDPPEGGYAYELGKEKGIRGSRDGLVSKNALASYTHLHFGARPEWAANFVEACRKHSRR